MSSVTSTQTTDEQHLRLLSFFHFVVECIECLFMPLGTALGIFTNLVLIRPSV